MDSQRKLKKNIGKYFGSKKEPKGDPSANQACSRLSRRSEDERRGNNPVQDSLSIARSRDSAEKTTLSNEQKLKDGLKTISSITKMLSNSRKCPPKVEFRLQNPPAIRPTLQKVPSLAAYGSKRTVQDERTAKMLEVQGRVGLSSGTSSSNQELSNAGHTRFKSGDPLGKGSEAYTFKEAKLENRTLGVQLFHTLSQTNLAPKHLQTSLSSLPLETCLSPEVRQSIRASGQLSPTGSSCSNQILKGSQSEMIFKLGSIGKKLESRVDRSFEKMFKELRDLRREIMSSMKESLERAQKMIKEGSCEDSIEIKYRRLEYNGKVVCKMLEECIREETLRLGVERHTRGNGTNTNTNASNTKEQELLRNETSFTQFFENNRLDFIDVLDPLVYFDDKINSTTNVPPPLSPPVLQSSLQPSQQASHPSSSKDPHPIPNGERGRNNFFESSFRK